MSAPSVLFDYNGELKLRQVSMVTVVNTKCQEQTGFYGNRIVNTKCQETIDFCKW